MIGFRDMTFCDHWRDCAKAAKCHRPLTPEVEAAARRWWGKDSAPIAVFTDKPGCHEAQEIKP
jgi:hypothetical protein